MDGRTRNRLGLGIFVLVLLLVLVFIIGARRPQQNKDKRLATHEQESPSSDFAPPHETDKQEEKEHKTKNYDFSDGEGFFIMFCSAMSCNLGTYIAHKVGKAPKHDVIALGLLSAVAGFALSLSIQLVTKHLFPSETSDSDKELGFLTIEKEGFTATRTSLLSMIGSLSATYYMCTILPYIDTMHLILIWFPILGTVAYPMLTIGCTDGIFKTIRNETKNNPFLLLPALLMSLMHGAVVTFLEMVAAGVVFFFFNLGILNSIVSTPPPVLALFIILMLLITTSTLSSRPTSQILAENNPDKYSFLTPKHAAMGCISVCSLVGLLYNKGWKSALLGVGLGGFLGTEVGSCMMGMGSPSLNALWMLFREILIEQIIRGSLRSRQGGTININLGVNRPSS